MGKRKKDDDGGVDLFSFLNIMTATIGVQTLMLVVFALQIKPGVQAVRLMPTGGSGKGKEANFIVCNGKGEVQMVRNNESEVIKTSDKRLDEFLEDIVIAKEKKDQYLVIGVRPNAYPDFEYVRSRATTKDILIGYEPLEQELEVKFPEQ